MPTIVFDSRVHPDARALAQKDHELVGPLLEDTPERREALARADALILSNMWEIREPEFKTAAKLKVIGRPGVGVDNIDLPAATRHGVCVVNTPDAPSQSTAEHAVSLIFALAKGLVKSDASLRARGWETRAEFFGAELKGKTLGLVGVGRIGGIVAKTCRDGLGMRVVAFDPFLDPARAEGLGVELRKDLNEVLREADFVSLHCALSPQTRGLIGRGQFEAMKPTACLVNCARGPIVDEAALIEALRSNRIAGAGLDVFETEPMAPGHPLLTLPNAIVTPHIASHTAECERAMHLGAMEQVLALLRGERPKSLVNGDVWEGRRRD
ncbi:MAG: hydroxyacid dehydrogenase [Planctomycetota bacterium]|nr:hydroxyacid dehydrogenase [Planctomycetota bacterium]